MVLAFWRWFIVQRPRLEKTTSASVTIEGRVGGAFAVVATWQATALGPAGRWEKEFSQANIHAAMREVRCKTRRGVAGAILEARGV